MPELTRRNAQNLFDKLIAVNDKKGLIRRTPALSQVAAWINQAGELPRRTES